LAPGRETRMAALGLGAMWARSVKAAKASRMVPPDASLAITAAECFCWALAARQSPPTKLVAADIRDRHVGGVLIRQPRRVLRGTFNHVQPVKGLQPNYRRFLLPPAFFISVDQEAGDVARLKTCLRLPHPLCQYLGGLQRPHNHSAGSLPTPRQPLSRRRGIQHQPRACSRLNINPNNPVIRAYGRSFSADPAICDKKPIQAGKYQLIGSATSSAPTRSTSPAHAVARMPTRISRLR